MPVKKARSITPLMIGLPPSAPFGRTTQRFFREGEEHEARQWEDVDLPPDDEPEPKRRWGSVDKVPRQRGAMAVLVIFGLGLLGGLSAGVSALLDNGNRVREGVAALKGWLRVEHGREPAPTPPVETAAPATGQQAGGPAENHAGLAVPSLAPEAVAGTATAPEAVPGTPTTAASSSLVPEAVAGTPTAAATLASAAPDEAPEPLPEIAPPAPLPAQAPTPKAALPVDEEVGRQDRATEHREADGKRRAAVRRRSSRENYVWSPEAQALVPLTSSAEVPAGPRGRPESAEQSAARRELAPPSAIAPPATVAPAPEKPAPLRVEDME